MKALFTPGFFLLWKSSCPIRGFKSKKQELRHLKNYIKSSNIFSRKGPMIPWKHKLTNIRMKASIHTKFFALSSSACPKWGFENKKQELRHFKIASKVQTYSQRRRPTRTSWKQKLTNITMKAIIHTRVFPLMEFNMSQMRFWKQNAGAQALKNYIKSSNVFSKKGPRINSEQKFTNIRMKASFHTKFFALSTSACPKWDFENKKQELMHFKVASKVQMYSQRRRDTRTCWKQKLTNITMKAIIHTKFDSLSSSACPKWLFESKKQELRHFKIASEVQMYSQRRRPTRTSWKQKLTNLTMKAIIRTNFFPLSSSPCPK